MKVFDHTLCVAPMMAYTDRHFRYLLRIISQQAVLYTEMVTAQAIIHGDINYLLGFSDEEHPIALQLGGSNPFQLAEACKLATDFHYDEINLNVGCPSERVQSGCFGAALMKEPDLVAECVKAMQDSTAIPITVKTRLGVDECDSDDFLHELIGKIAETGCTTFIMHARKAWLKGLSPKENREIPPLEYDRVYRLKKCFPQLKIIINGGITDKKSIEAHLKFVDGVMLGRVVCSNPYFLNFPPLKKGGDIAPAMSGGFSLSREKIIFHYLPYILKEYSSGTPLRHMTRHLIGLYQGEPGARAWRRLLSDATVGDRQLLYLVQKRGREATCEPRDENNFFRDSC
ncbi:MAG: tRNA dihydrouridine(20/20a) synthase DusA [Gammaproteobacteria bacterium RIFCSPHIGHO2_12_FULL_38_11]|nr:MAG: tRNA dihydrouridine(20/20a) synthase DusA [Gammaproteobacteria bacterium RIFCSPHIGHO2_12_FULL_38_11]